MNDGRKAFCNAPWMELGSPPAAGVGSDQTRLDTHRSGVSGPENPRAARLCHATTSAGLNPLEWMEAIATAPARKFAPPLMNVPMLVTLTDDDVDPVPYTVPFW